MYYVFDASAQYKYFYLHVFCNDLVLIEEI